ncbi:intracellular coagulation inhibitor 2-like [Ixodes scapularis]|uniref:intracellular coagulation inhibitor 2-like n=1 Tax=Ixodes scapularis TaxID=6945 RepID=UPI001A9FE894|nr:intracellular coagulation inhibitor 2-like [Ixodes scapularis]
MESEVNEWVKIKTRGKISGFEIPPNTIMALLNAIYFKGLWNTSFDPNNTSILPFHNKGAEVVMVETMTRLAKVPFTSEPQFEAIDLSYKGDQHCMVIILPSEKKELPKLRDAMTVESIEQIQGSLKDETAKIQLPKFDLKTE